MKEKILIIVSTLIAVILLAAGFLFFRTRQIKIPTPGNSQTAFIPSSISQSLKGALSSLLSPEKSTVESPPSNTASSVPSPPADSGASANNFSFAILGDSRHFGNSPNGGMQLAVGLIEKQNVSFAISEGDVIDGCDGGNKCLQKYTAWKNILGPLMDKTYAVNGNHDCTTPEDEAIWRKVFNFPTNGPADHLKLTYSFSVDNSHFVVLDTENPSAHKVDSEQLQWLDQDLTESKAENNFVLYHEPAFPSSTETKDALDAKPDGRDALWKILDKHNVTAVFNGHEHFYARWKIDTSVFPGAKNSIEQFVVGNTDVNDADTPKAGQYDAAYATGKSFAIVSVNGKNITLNEYAVDGKLVDIFAFSK